MDIELHDLFKRRIGSDIPSHIIDELVLSDANILRPVKGHAFEVIFDRIISEELGGRIEEVGGDSSIDRIFHDKNGQTYTLQLKTPVTNTIKLKDSFQVTLHKTHGTEKRPKNLYPTSWPCRYCEHDGDDFPQFLIVFHPESGVLIIPKEEIPESRQLGGFPISGTFLVCNNPEVVDRHDAKVYGKEPPGTPPMTVPHLDRRYLEDNTSLLFGPFAAIGPKFLKEGSNLDLFKSLKSNNILTMLSAGVKNLPLVKYSIQQVMMDKEDRMKELRKFVPDAKDEDWDLHVAGKRVQVIKDTEEHGRGYIQFGTEVVHSEDNTVIALLGESPGASVSVSTAIEVFEKSFPAYIEKWTPKIQDIIPSYGQSLIEDSELLKKIRKSTAQDLKL